MMDVYDLSLPTVTPLKSGADHHIRWSPETPIACNAIVPTLRRGNAARDALCHKEQMHSVR